MRLSWYVSLGNKEKKRNSFQWDNCNFEYHIPKYKINSSYLKRTMKCPAGRGILFRCSLTSVAEVPGLCLVAQKQPWISWIATYNQILFSFIVLLPFLPLLEMREMWGTLSPWQRIRGKSCNSATEATKKERNCLITLATKMTLQCLHLRSHQSAYTMAFASCKQQQNLRAHLLLG